MAPLITDADVPPDRATAHGDPASKKDAPRAEPNGDATVNVHYILFALLSFPLPLIAVAQEPPERILTRSAAFDAEPFTRIRGMQEMANGALLIADQVESAVYLIDLGAGTRTRVGREGSGPEEYRQPTGMYPFRGDSALLMDITNSRFAILSTDGRIARTEPIFRPGTSIPTGADRDGDLYWDHVSSVRIAKSTDPSADRAPIARLGQTTSRIDTLAFLTMPGPTNPNAFPTWDVWAVSLDGRIAIARNQDEYRMDWVEPDGRTTRGPPVAWEPVRVTDADRDALRAQPGGGRGSGVSVRGGAGARPPLLDLPDQFPAVRQRGLWIAHDGRAFVERQQPLTRKSDSFSISSMRMASALTASDCPLTAASSASVRADSTPFASMLMTCSGSSATTSAEHKHNWRTSCLFDPQ
jgi:hypothetical protein